MNKNLVSVIVPIYNVEVYLPKCIESILNQTYDYMEIILVNDGSPDNSYKICKEYSGKDNRIKIIDKPNGGLSDARNAGLKVATGEYVIFVDSDDSIERDLIYDAYTAIRKYDADICYFNYSSVDEKGNYLNQNILELENKIYDLNNININNYLVTNIFTYKHGVEAWNKIYKMEIIKDYQLSFSYNQEIFAEDLLFNLSYLTHVTRAVTIPKSYYNYLIRTDSIMGKPKENLFGRYLELFSRLKVYWNKYESDMVESISLGYFIWLILTIKLKFNEGLGVKQVTKEFKDISKEQEFKKMRNEMLYGSTLKIYIKKCPGKLKHALLLYIIALSTLVKSEVISILLIRKLLVIPERKNYER